MARPEHWESALPEADYKAARAAFVQMKDDASARVEQIKKDLGEKWAELTKAEKK